MSEGRDRMIDAVLAVDTILPDAPDPRDQAGAIVDAIIALGGSPDHIVRIKAMAWTIQHPLDERFAEHGSNSPLFSCYWNQHVADAAPRIAQSQGDGTYRVFWDDEHTICWRRLE